MINSLLKAIDILQAFNPSEPRLTLAEISKRLGMPKGTTHNLLTTLLSRNFIEKTDDGRYALGAGIIPLTQAVRINVELRDRAAPLLRNLADHCRDSVYLTALYGDYGLYIYAIESPHRLLARTAVGDITALHCTSVGKAILSRLPGEEVEAIMQRTGMEKFTENTITDIKSLHADLEKTRQQGYALDNAEHEDGLYCIGAPILNHNGQVIAACSVSGLNHQELFSKVDDLSNKVMLTALEISRRMGYVPSRPANLNMIPKPK